jgi:hypothetical protein
VYTVTLRRRQVRDSAGNAAASAVLGAFGVKIPSAAVTRAVPTLPFATTVSVGGRHKDDVAALLG